MNDQRGVANAVLVLWLCFLSCPATAQPLSEVRGVWLNPPAFDAANRDATLAKILAAKLNTVFLAAPPVNGNYGWADPYLFQDFIDMARAQGLAVHGWIANHWRSGKANADFTDPVERAAQVQWALDVLGAYPGLAGIHFDYIRYKSWGMPDAAKMGGITETIRLTREALDTNIPGKLLTATTFAAAAASYLGSGATWEGDTPQWFRDWHQADPNNWYIVQGNTDPALDPNWLLGPTHFSFQQNSPLWLGPAYAHSVIPMQYSSNRGTWRDEVDLWKSFTSFLGSGFDRLAMGLGWLTEAGHDDWTYDAGALVDHIKYGRSQGVTGFVIFEFGTEGIDDQPLIDALTVDGLVNDFDAPFKQSAKSWLGGPVCGDGVVELGEGCDDGNLVDGDGCDSNCTRTACGNSVITAGEQCDDGNTVGGDCCSAACQIEADGSPCSDGNACSFGDICAAGLCTGNTSPLTGCRQAPSAQLSLDRRGRGKIKWKWKKGAATAAADWGNPVGGNTDFLICLYDAAASVPSVEMSAKLPAGGSCDGKPCWKTKGSKRLGYKSRSGAAGGVTKLKIKAGPDGKARLQVQGKGTGLVLPRLPLAQDGSVTIQLSNTTGACWESVFPAPSKFNYQERFQDKL